MRVLMVSCDGLGTGGIQTVIMSIVRKLHNSISFDALLFTNEKRFYDDEFMSYGGKIHRIPFSKPKNPILRKLYFFFRQIRLYRQLCNLFKTNSHYDAVHCNNSFEGFICLKAAKKHGIPVRISHSHQVSSKAENKIISFINRLCRLLFKGNCTHMIGCSEEACISLFGKKRNWLVVNNPYNEQIFSPKLYERNESNDSVIRLLQVGFFCDNKNQMFSLEILKNIIQSGQNATLNLVGFGEYKEKIKEKIESLNLESYVTIFSQDTNIPELLCRTDFFLLPSHEEGFGIVLIEAQAMGVPCYVSDTVPKNTNVGGCTYLPLNDSSKWADKIIEDFKNNKRNNLGYNCEDFSTENIAKIYEKIYSGELL